MTGSEIIRGIAERVKVRYRLAVDHLVPDEEALIADTAEAYAPLARLVDAAQKLNHPVPIWQELDDALRECDAAARGRE